ncbi:M1 family metallopeptidase [Microlunatus panaciterrae]|uniref:Aminopeptidase N n=1 Tax=Microlunatus panaciterrae TaxID=400768 RepID=A0ABS2RFN9_9ACTN|nr:M1 family metallopeptidase [Microlunatus panaciterrae]MBM7797777.1 aminopeptidase N [Microlunatus panaciterrae]
MSNADPPPTWPPPRGHQPHRVAYVFAVVLPLLVVLALLVPFAVAYGLGRWQAADRAAGAPPSVVATEGAPGVGDPYFPDYGSSGYDVYKYTISIDWDTRSQRMTSTTVISAHSTQTLQAFYFDLALKTDRVRVNGQQALFEHTGFQDVKVTPAAPIAANTDFEVVVDYSGAPGAVKRGQVSAWHTTNQEWTVAGEPESSAWWFPANDHPSDPALMDVSVRVPAGMEVISVGRLESRDTAAERDHDTWHWMSRQPLATYLNFISIGQFQLEQGVAQGRPFVYAVSEQFSPEQRIQLLTELRRSGAIVQTLEKMFGPYPFTELGGVVPAAKLWFAGLETQTRPVYEGGAMLNRDFAPELIAHELAHMWFGDNVTVRQWNDIFTNEAYASWAQWGYTERSGGRSAEEAFTSTFADTEHKPNFWRVTMIDPGKDHLFETVYARGPMTLQALRNVIGDRAFFRLAQEWSQDPGSRSLEDWMIKAQSTTKIDLTSFFQAWIFSPTAPRRTAENGFR